MKKAIGLLEFRSISQGVQAADKMVKAANVQLLQAMPVCPGKFIAIVAGDVGSVNSAVERGKAESAGGIIDEFILANINDSVIPAISGVTDVKNKDALGIVETFSAASAIVAADIAAKAAVVELVEVRIARGMGGKSILYFTGDVGAVNAALDACKVKVMEEGMLLNIEVIPSPAAEIWEHIL